MTASPINPNPVRAYFDSPAQSQRAPYRSAVRGAIVREMLGPPVEGVRILDLGCGDGGVSLPLLGNTNELTLVDFAPRMLDVAREAIPSEKRGRVSLVLSSVDDFRPAAPYDIVLCLGVLAHVPSIDSAMAKIVECLKPGGSAIVELTPDPLGWKRRMSLYYALAKAMKKARARKHELNRMLPDEFVALASGKGLTLRRVRRHSVPLPGLALLPTAWQYRYAFLASRHPLLSQFGIEYVHFFTKS